MIRRFTILSVLLVMTAAAVGFYTFYSPAQTAPSLTLTLLNGQLLTLESLRKNPLLVYFWATTCATCLEEMPTLTKLYHEFSPQGFQIVGIAMYYDPPNRIVYFAKNNQLPYFMAFDLERVAAQAFGEVKWVPTHFLIDQKGNIVYTRKGKLQESSLRQRITQLLEKP